jgi:hypothetical protein
MPYEKYTIKYKNEREDICNKLLSIVGSEFLLSELDADTKKQQEILELKEDIRKYFAVGTVSSFKPNLQDTVKRSYLNIVRFVAKQQGYTVEYKDQVVKHENDNGFYKRTLKYKIFREM